MNKKTERLLEAHLQQLQALAAQFRQKKEDLYEAMGVEEDDLVQEAVLILLDAAEAFDPDRGEDFAAFANTVARHAMVDYVRRQGRTTKGRNLWRLVSLDDEEENVEELSGGLDSEETRPEPIVIAKDLHQRFQTGFSGLQGTHRQYLRYRYCMDREHSRNETAAHFCLTPRRAKQTEEQALTRLREGLEQSGYLAP